jgi:hypothetical protein
MGGVRAVVDPWDGLVRTGVVPWPPAELIQKLYQSRQVRAFRDADLAGAKSKHGFYSDLQSLNSEDALTWSVFGPIAYAELPVRLQFAASLLGLIGFPKSKPASAAVWLWRRLPHPDTLVSGGPEIDFGVQTEDVYVIGEAKWLSGVSGAQGAAHDKDQLQLRREFCEKYGRRLLPGCKAFVVVGVSLGGGLVTPMATDVDGVELRTADLTWETLCSMESHPLRNELSSYLQWKREYAHAPVA